MDKEILKRGGGVSVGHHGWPTKKILGFRWSKKAKIILETVSFWSNISISIFKFSPFFYTMKSYQFFKSYKRFDKERKKHPYSSQWENKNWEKMDSVS